MKPSRRGDLDPLKLTFKFQGTGKHVIWLDEEPPADVYDECLLRLMTTNGLLIATFTPLLGLSDVAMRFLPELAPQET